MVYLLRRGKGALRRKAHLCLHDPRTGQPDMKPLCGINQPFNMTSNVPWGCATCKNCRKAAASPR